MLALVILRLIALLAVCTLRAAAQTCVPGSACDGASRSKTCQQDSDCTTLSPRCISSIDDEYLYTYNFGPEFVNLPPFMPYSEKGCNLILRPKPEQKAGEERLEDFQNMLAFPYCSQTEDQAENQKQAKGKEIPIVYETKEKGDGPWYILEKLRKEGETEVHPEKLYRVEKNGDVNEVKGINAKKLRFPSPYLSGVGNVEESILQMWRDREIMLPEKAQGVERELAKYYVYVDRTSRRSCQQ